MAKYSTAGGQYEIDNFIALLNPKPAKEMVALPGAIVKFEHDFRQYKKRS